MKIFDNFMIFLCLIVSFFVFTTDLTYCDSKQLKDSVTIGPYTGQFDSLQEALDHVRDGGTILIDKNLYDNPYNFDEVTINKNINILSSDTNNPANIQCNSSVLFNINSPYNLYIKDIKFESTNPDNVIINSHTDNIFLENVSFNTNMPFIFNKPSNNSPFNMNIKSCTFKNISPKIHLPVDSNGLINFENNTIYNNTLLINNSGAQINVLKNNFNSSGITIEDSSEGIVNIQSNVFEGFNTRLTSNSSNDVTITNNSISSSLCFVCNNDASNTLNMQKNWWGSNENPINNSSYHFTNLQNIDCSNWSIDKDFTHYVNDPKFTIYGNVLLKNCYKHENIDVILMLDDTQVGATTTSISGNFNFDSLYCDEYTLSIYHDRFNTVIENVYSSSDDVNFSSQLSYDWSLFDLNNDNIKDTQDLDYLFSQFENIKNNNDWDNTCDINMNGFLDIMDIIMFIRH